MRRFRFVGDQTNANNYQENIPELNKVYDGDDCVGLLLNTPVIVWANLYPEEWQEVSNEKTASGILDAGHMPKYDVNPTLHKDTDLGYYAGLAMQGILATGQANLHDKDGIVFAIEWAKELIKQLDKEVKGE